MNQLPREKPIVEILQDIHATGHPRPPRGLINPKLVARITFFASCIVLLLTTAVILAMIWSAMESLLGLRCIASMGALVLALQVFRAINEQFD